MIEKLLDFISRHESFTLTTHDPADADGIGAEMVLACILRARGKQARIINAQAMPEQFRFMDPQAQIAQWNGEQHGALPEQDALLVVDIADESTVGEIAKFSRWREVFAIDHHELKPRAAVSGIFDPSSASTCELAVELAQAAGVTLDPATAFAAYSGIVYDTGFFAYPKTEARTFRAALALFEMGANPSKAFTALCQDAPARVLHLQQRSLASMALHCGDRVATQVLREKDFEETGGLSKDTNGFVNFPLKSRDIVVSLLVKQTPGKLVNCSVRSKGAINVAKIAQEFGGGGHINAAGYETKLNVDQALSESLAAIEKSLNGQQ